MGEGGRPGEAGDQLARGQAVILVQHRDGDVAHVIGGGVGEHEELQQRRPDQHEAAARVAPDRQDLLHDQAENALPHDASRRFG
jgi:hypothetical protein